MIRRHCRNCFCINLSSLELIKILFPIEGQLWFETADWWTAKDAREIQRTIKSMCDNEQETPYRKGEWWMGAWTLYPKMLSVCHCCGPLSYLTWEYFKVGLFRRFMVWQLEFFLAWTTGPSIQSNNLRHSFWLCIVLSVMLIGQRQLVLVEFIWGVSPQNSYFYPINWSVYSITIINI